MLLRGRGTPQALGQGEAASQRPVAFLRRPWCCKPTLPPIESQQCAAWKHWRDKNTSRRAPRAGASSRGGSRRAGGSFVEYTIMAKKSFPSRHERRSLVWSSALLIQLFPARHSWSCGKDPCQQHSLETASSSQGSSSFGMVPAAGASCGCERIRQWQQCPAWHVVAIPQAWRGQADPLPCLEPGLVLEVHHEQLVSRAGVGFQRQDVGSELGPCRELALGTGTAGVTRGSETPSPRPLGMAWHGSAWLGMAQHTWTATADVRLAQSRDAAAAQGWGHRDPVLAQELHRVICPLPQGLE